MKDRIIYFDILRIISILAVVQIHVCTNLIKFFEIDTSEWIALIVYDAISRFCVPIFLMISGAVLLEKKNESVEVVWKKRIVRIVQRFTFWSGVYAIVELFKWLHNGYLVGVSIKSTIIHFINGHYHLWFLLALVGIYACLPIIRRITVDVSLSKYCLMLLLASNCILPIVNDLFLSRYGISSISTVFEVLPGGYLVYFVLGWYLNTLDTRKIRIFNVLWVLIGAALVTVFCGYRFNTKESITAFWEYRSINILFMSSALFLLVKMLSEKMRVSDRIQGIVGYFGRRSFGVYLIHVLVMDVTFWMIERWQPIKLVLLIVPTYSLAVFGISYVCDWLLLRIPYMNRTIQ